ncbi:hypothetical protein BUALT_Bualt17G0055300 [Buddleja alternifolia]|uniref:TORTIFOLIA1/SINE1-2 N-terminal domain-containing protein n=1 Tax=Buddleja alternifolia TaxID=168488 RepID=A0AAV6W825_9LAMI|nr:hypothetical protein BUALT_Bualt17G0055300 [Buddleja alternifolia]
MSIPKQHSGELKKRVNTCLNKLSDRDTLSMATNELEIIAKALPSDAFAPFLNCISSTDSSEKSPVRRQCVRLLGVLSAAHGDALSPHLSRMIASVLRRLRDPDTAVRSACVDAVSSIATHVNSTPFSAILKPLVDALFHEQDLSAQIGASLCLSAAVEAAPEPDAAELRKLLPKLVKLVKSDCFKAKSALLSFVGSIVRANCVKSKSMLSPVVSIGVEFLSSDDWAARKAAAEVLAAAAAAERSLAGEFRDSCVAALENKRFDKVKVVRETMNRALDMWRDVPLSSQELPSPKDTSNREHSPVFLSKSPVDIAMRTPQPSKMVPTRSPASSCSSSSNSQRSIIRNEDNKSCVSSATKLNLRRNFRSRVVPVNIIDNLNMGDGDVMKEKLGNGKEFEDMSLIRNQLRYIEIQQSSLLDLLQRYIGTSQKGMSSLEKRVDGLEKVLDEMSQDLAISTRRIPNTHFEGNTCCMIPGTEFLSPRFWKKTESQTVNSKFSISLKNQSLNGMNKC